MSKEFVDHHIAGASNVSLVLGEWPVFALNCSYKKAINDAFSIASDNVQDECAIVGLRLSPMREAVHWLGNLVGFELTFQGGLECFKQEVGKSGWKFGLESRLGKSAWRVGLERRPRKSDWKVGL